MSETLDIVALVQNNPLTRLSSLNYESHIVNKIKEKFNSNDEQLFVANFYCYLNYDTRKDLVIDLDKIYRWLGFGKKSDCKSLLINNFKENEDFVVSKNHEKSAAANSAAVQNGGQNRETILLTIRCFKKLCLKAKTKKSNDIHEYYLNLEELINETIAEESAKLRNQLQIKDQEFSKQLNNKDKEREQNLILNFKNKQVVYLIMVEENIVKFGYCKDIKKRITDHRTEFGKDIILHSVFETIYNREFETMIKQDSVLEQHIIEKKYKNNQTELIQLDSSFTMLQLEERMEKLKENINGDLIQNLMKEIAELKLKLSKYESDEIRNREIELKEKNYELNKQKLEYALSTTPVTPKKDQYVYQVYDPKNLKLIKTYNTIQDAVNEKKLYKDAISQSISRAVRTNRIYKGYRFWRITQADEIKEYQIPKTEEVDRSAKFEQIVQMNSDNTEIKGIFSCAEEAAIKNAKEGATADDIRKMRKSIINNLSIDGLSYNHHWYRISEAPEDLVNVYLETNELPEVSIGKRRVQVHKYTKDGELIMSYKSMAEATKAEKISDVTLKKYITNKTLVNDQYLFRT